MTIGLLALSGAQPPTPALAEGPTLSPDRVSARGRQTATLEIPRFGRYSIRVTSPQGTALQLTDRMAGPGEVAGAAGERDGRLDLFLDRGDYQVSTLGHRAASGEAALEVRAFAEVDAETPRRLEPLRLVSSSLRDLEERAWWLDLRQAAQIELEAAGRSLADLRLWRDGLWLVDAAPTRERLQPLPGQPLAACRVVVRLEPGLYRVAAYGGPPLPWRRRHVISPFGIDRYRVSGEATSVRLELPEAVPAELGVSGFDSSRPYDDAGSRARIEKESLPPVAELEPGKSQSEHLVTVRGEAGQPYVLQHYQKLDHYSFSGDRPHWVSTVHSGHAADSIDATGLLIERGPVAPEHVEPLRSQVIEVGPDTLWRRRANLLGTTTLFLRFGTAGSYTVLVEDADARVRLEPFLLSPPPGYQAPPFRKPGEAWDLDAGFYRLTLEPVRQGVAIVEVRPAGFVDRMLRTVGLADPALEEPVAGAIRFDAVTLRREHRYELYFNRQPGVGVGAVVRPLPLDLSDPLPVWQRPGEEVEVPFRQAEAGTVTAEAEDGALLELSLDGGPWQRTAAVLSGPHRVRVRVAGDATQAYSLGFVSERLAPDSPLPVLSPERLASLPEFPRLGEGAAVALDLGPAPATFLLETPEPGLYRIESTGLLATGGTLRTRTNPALVGVAENGVGRNFAIQTFLTRGDFQLSVAARGRSAGHLGLRLRRSPLQRGGFLTLYRPARRSLSAGEAVEYRFVITEPGEFRVRALGQSRTLRCRLEDREG